MDLVQQKQEEVVWLQGLTVNQACDLLFTHVSAPVKRSKWQQTKQLMRDFNILQINTTQKYYKNP